MSCRKLLRSGFVGIEIVALVTLVVALVAGTQLVQNRQSTESSAACGGCDGVPPGAYGCNPNQGGKQGICDCDHWRYEYTAACPAPSTPSCGGCENGTIPNGYRGGCNVNQGGKQGICDCNGWRYEYNSTCPAPPAPTTAPQLPSCGPANTLKCINGKSAWCNASGKLEVGTKACGTNVCHPTASGAGCADPNNYRVVGTPCGTSSTCNSTGTNEGFASCTCKSNLPTPPTTCAGVGGTFCNTSTHVCSGIEDPNFSSDTQLCCKSPATCKPKPPQQICTKNAVIGCTPDGDRQLCNSTGLGYVSQSCNGKGCNPTSKECRICAVGEKRCTGTSVEICNAAGTVWVVQSQCGAVGCNITSKSCNTCVANATFCEGSLSRRCNPTGTTISTLENCALGCNTANGKCNQCAAGERRCDDATGNLLTCNAARNGFDTKTCEFGCGADPAGALDCRQYDTRTRCVQNNTAVCTRFSFWDNTCTEFSLCSNTQHCEGPIGNAGCVPNVTTGLTQNPNTVAQQNSLTTIPTTGVTPVSRADGLARLVLPTESLSPTALPSPQAQAPTTILSSPLARVPSLATTAIQNAVTVIQNIVSDVFSSVANFTSQLFNR